jgi:hypothetical protein
MKSEYDPSCGLTMIFSPRSGAVVRKKLHRDCSMWNSTMSWTPKSKRTLSDFQWSFTRPQTVDGLGVTMFERWSVLLNTEFLGRLQQRKKNKIWGCSDGILSWSWLPKCWSILPAFHQLLIQPYLTNGLEVVEFCASTNCWNLFGTERQLNRDQNPKARLNWNSWLSEYNSVR